MNRDELKEIICRIIAKMSEPENDTPANACIFDDGGSCDVTTKYALGEEG